MQKFHKLIAPILFTLLFLLCLIGMIFLCLTEVVSLAFKIIGIVFCAAFIGGSVFVLIERVKEVRSGKKMMIVTTDNIAGRAIETLGLVKGVVVFANRDLGMEWGTLKVGELSHYTDMMLRARTEAVNRMIWESQQIQADAIVALRYDSALIIDGAIEVCAYGTAVKFI